MLACFVTLKFLTIGLVRSHYQQANQLKNTHKLYFMTIITVSLRQNLKDSITISFGEWHNFFKQKTIQDRALRYSLVSLVHNFNFRQWPYRKKMMYN